VFIQTVGMSRDLAVWRRIQQQEQGTGVGGGCGRRRRGVFFVEDDVVGRVDDEQVVSLLC
jgi:hypothetical protein